jgi:hypothetical protein
MLQPGDVHVEPPGPDAQHDPGQHRAEHDVQAELARHGEQQEQQHHRPAQRDLPGRILALPDDPLYRLAVRQPRDDGQHDGEQAHEGDGGERDEGPAPGQEHGDDQDGEQFADRARREHVPAELSAEHVVVPQDRQQRAERGGGQGQPDRHVVLDVARDGQPSGYPHGQPGGDHPADHGEAAGFLPEQMRLELVAGQQEQEAEPDVGQQLDAGQVGQAEHVRADYDAADQEHHDLRNARAGQQGDHDRRERGHQCHGHQVEQSLSKVHDAPPRGDY